jgi:glycogen operon protein
VAGNRFNPNKLLIDPYAVELSHDPEPRLSFVDPNEPTADYDTGPGHRAVDTGPLAPKSVLPLRSPAAATGVRPRRPLRDDVVYETHVRGLTKVDPSVPAELQGTYEGAALKAGYLRDLGVTAVELMPVQHFASEQNDDGDPRGDNYWGYMTLGFFAPNRRYAADRSPGGPILEFKGMVRAFHEAGIKVILDVVLNHTGEGLLARDGEGGDSRMDDARQFPERARLLSLRGLDNATYYTLRSSALDGRPNQRYQDNSACGPAPAVARPQVRELLVDILSYWVDEMGVDGFRFDLAPVLGNSLPSDGFAFDAADPDGLLQQLGRRLPLRTAGEPDGVDLVAEPWAVGDGTYQLGRFPAGWAQWNDVFRIVARRAENKFRVQSVRPWELANVVSGSRQQFQPPDAAADDGGPSWSVNYVSAHDGLTLRDVYSVNGDDEAWDHGGDLVAQRQAVRNAVVLLVTSAGVPMIQGGDELFRTLGGNRNTVAIDDERTWLHWDGVDGFLRAERDGDEAAAAALRERDDVRTYLFTRAMLGFRAAHPALRRDRFFTGTVLPGGTLRDLAWYGPDGRELTDGWDDPDAGFLGWRVAEPPSSLFVAYTWRDQWRDVALPPNQAGARWHRVADTAAWMEPLGNVDVPPGPAITGGYGMHPRSLAVFVEAT